ncbi:MAG: hypothetical protein ACXVA9_09330, partial [Bdellovibrionales bacterium]
GVITSVQLLDLWEAEALYGEHPQASTGILQADVDIMLRRLQYSYFEEMEGAVENGGPIFKGQGYLLAYIRMRAKEFLLPNAKVLRLRGVNLTLTDDSYELAKPRDCEIEQIVNFQATGRILIDQDLFDKMDMINQAALITHEAYYSYLRFAGGDTNSVRTRRATGYVISGGVFSLPPSPVINKQAIWCYTDNNDIEHRDTISIYRMDSTAPSNEKLGISPLRVYGTRLVGQSHLEFSVTSEKSEHFVEEVLTGKCKGNGFATGFGMQFSGPVEFDHAMNIYWTCRNGNIQTYVDVEVLGIKIENYVPLTCAFHQP